MINIIGGGVIGCIQAVELKKLGYEVSIYEKNTIGSGSSLSGAGIMFPLLPHFYSNLIYELIHDSKKYYDVLNVTLSNLFDIDIEHIKSGMLVNIDQPDPLEEWLIKNQLNYQKRSKCLLIDEVYQINPKKLIAGLARYINYLGIDVYENKPIKLNSKKQFVDDFGMPIKGDVFILSTGAWTSQINSSLSGKIYPIRGQLIEFNNQKNLKLKSIIYKNGFYLLQRRDGSLIAGSTLEDVGFNEHLLNSDLIMLRKKAEDIMPELKDVEISQHWSGFRPGSKDNIPIIVRDNDIPNTFYNTGHFRYGLSMAPASVNKLINLI